MTYIVMKVKRSYAVILDEDGKFYHAANLNYSVGDCVENPFILNVEENEGYKSIPFFTYVKRLVPIACAIVLVFGMNIYNNSVLASYILKINPEVEITIDRRNRVKNIVAKNNDGFYLLDGYEHQSKDYRVVTNELVDRAIELGYLKDNGDVAIKMITSGMTKISDEINEDLDKHLSEDYNINIHIFDHDEDIDDSLDDIEDELEDDKDDDFESDNDNENSNDTDVDQKKEEANDENSSDDNITNEESDSDLEDDEASNEDSEDSQSPEVTLNSNL